MRLPDDYEDHGSGLTPTVVSAIVAVTIFVVVILTVVLIITGNRRLINRIIQLHRRRMYNRQEISRQQSIRIRRI